MYLPVAVFLRQNHASLAVLLASSHVPELLRAGDSSGEMQSPVALFDTWKPSARLPVMLQK